MTSDVRSKVARTFSSVFIFEVEENNKLINMLSIGFIFIIGIVFWLRFVNFGDIPKDRLDWMTTVYPQLTIFKEALTSGKLPLHISQVDGIKGITDRILVVADLTLSPNLLLLKYVSIEFFICSHILIFYSAGFIGLVRLKNKLKLSNGVFLPFFFLFNFNGHIVAHLSVGHLIWVNYFLAPYFIHLILDIQEKQARPWNWIFRYTILQFIIIISGGYHFFVYSLFFLGLLWVIKPGEKRYLFFAMITSSLVTAVRIFPAALIQETFEINFATSFSTLGKLINGLIALTTPEVIISEPGMLEMTSWELNYYIGVVGFLFVSIFGFLYFRNEKNKSRRYLLFPVIILFLLSLGNYYRPIFETGLPILGGERVSARLIILPLVMMFVFASIALQDFFNSKERKTTLVQSIFSVSFLILINDLSQHLAFWSFDNISLLIPPEYKYINLAIENRFDPTYFYLLLIGIGISVFSLAFVLIMNQREKKEKCF